MIPVILITGFLGSGKTTLLSNILNTENASIRKGILINDFGPVPVDAEFIKVNNAGDDLELYEISNGSVFCSCNKVSFIIALKTLAGKNIDMLFIETSGISDPTGFKEMLNKHSLDASFSIHSVFTLIDPVKTIKLLTVLPAIQKQISAATHIIYNKTDLIPETVTEKDFSNLKNQIYSINPQAKLIETSYCKIEPVILNQIINSAGCTALAEKSKANNSLLESISKNTNTPSSRPGSIVLSAEIDSLESINSFFQSISGLYYRVKGFLDVSGQTYYFSDTENGVAAEKWEHSEKTEKGITAICPPEYVEKIHNTWCKTFL